MGVRCDGFVLSRSQAGNILLAQKLAVSTRDDTHVPFHGIQSLLFHVYKLRENTKTAQLNAGVHHSPSPLLWERAQSLWASPGISRKAPRLLSSPTRSRASLYVKWALCRFLFWGPECGQEIVFWIMSCFRVIGLTIGLWTYYTSYVQHNFQI